MVKQYPHTGKKITVGDSDLVGGNWAEGVETSVDIKCRIEPNKGNQYVIGVDGSQIIFSGVVYMPLPVEEIKPGTLFEVWDGERLITKSTVKQFSKGQLNARVWL